MGVAFVYDPGAMLRGGAAEVPPGGAVRAAALVAITAADAGHLAAPMGPAAQRERLV